MIKIINMGPHDDPDPLGERTYELWVHSELITTFRHKRADGLGLCLVEAAKAVERQKWEDARKRLAEIRECDKESKE